jgi:8-oxo-dGTP pyrophosphatase MutT (NUDIX family)
VTLHADTTRLLDGWRPPDAEQVDLRSAYLRHLATHADGMWRSCVPDHLTTSVLILSADHRRVLLTLHWAVRLWLQTGGHCEPDDATLVGAALREGREESGIDKLRIDPVPVRLARGAAGCDPEGPTVHLDVQFLAVAPPDADPRRSAESLDLAWFDVDALPAETDDMVRALVRDGTRRMATTSDRSPRHK